MRLPGLWRKWTPGRSGGTGSAGQTARSLTGAPSAVNARPRKCTREADTRQAETGPEGLVIAVEVDPGFLSVILVSACRTALSNVRAVLGQ